MKKLFLFAALFFLTDCFSQNIRVHTYPKYGLLNSKTNTFIIKPVYPYIKAIGKGYFAFSLVGKASNEKSLLLGIMDSTGQVRIPPKYKTISNLNADTMFLSCKSNTATTLDLCNIRGKVNTPENYTIHKPYYIYCGEQFLVAKKNKSTKAVTQYNICDSKGKLLLKSDFPETTLALNEGMICFKLSDGYQFYDNAFKINTYPVVTFKEVRNIETNLESIYVLQSNGEFFNLPAYGNERKIKISDNVVHFQYTDPGNFYIFKGTKNSFRPLMMDGNTPQENGLNPVYDTMYKFAYLPEGVLFGLGKNSAVEYITSAGRVLRKKKSWDENEFEETLTLLRDSIAKKIRMRNDKFIISNDPNDVQKLAIRNNWEDTAMTSPVFSYVIISNKKYFVCKKSDSTLINNCALLDSNLREIIPYGKFTDIILSDDSKYASVGGPFFRTRIRDNPNYTTDTTTLEIKKRLWGVYEIKSGKLIIPFQYAYIGKISKEGIAQFNEGGLYYPNGQGGLFGILNIKNQIICKPQYTFIGNFNEAQIAIAMSGGVNTDGVYGGNLIVINKNGQNINPNFSLIENPLVKTIETKTSEKSEFINSKALNELMHFKAGLSDNQKDSLFNLIYTAQPLETAHSSFSEYGDEINEPYTRYDIYEHDSKVNINEPLPSNFKYTYFPVGPVKNWGKYASMQTLKTQEYHVFANRSNTPLAAFYSVDSIYISSMDSVSMDYEYPGIAVQNKETLNSRFYSDIKTKQGLFDKLYAESCIYHYSSSDTLIHKVQGLCDTAVTVKQFCYGCLYPSEELIRRTYYKKNFGLIVNQIVVLPPVYKLITQVTDERLIVIDTADNSFSYDVVNNKLTPINEKFVQFFSKGNNETPTTFTPKILITKINSGKIHIYHLANKFDYVADSIKLLVQTEGEIYDANGSLTFGIFNNFYTDPHFTNDYDLVVFKSDSMFRFSNDGLPAYELRITHARQFNVSSDPQKVNRQFTINKIKYSNHYLSDSKYLLEIGANKYVYSNGDFVTANFIKADSVKQISPYVIYYSGNKMFIARITNKTIKTGKLTLTKYYLSVFDSAKQLGSLVNYPAEWGNLSEYYSADGKIKCTIPEQKVDYFPSNFKTLPVKKQTLYYYDPERMVVRAQEFYILEENNKTYLCKKNDSYMSDGETGTTVFKEEYLEKVDSAKNFSFKNILQTNDNAFMQPQRFMASYITEGTLKSARNSEKLPFGINDSLILLNGTYNVDVFAKFTDKKWVVTFVNLMNSSESKTFPEFSFKSLAELKKSIYPHTRDQCDQNIPYTNFTKHLTLLGEKAQNKEPW